MPWIGDLFKGAFLLGDGTWWGLREKISEKRLLDQEGRDRNNGITLVEAQAVYHCMQTEGPEVGKEAIMKVRLQ